MAGQKKIQSQDVVDNALTYGNLQQASTVVLLGNPTGSTANIQEITLGTNLSFSGSTLNATGGISSLTVGTTPISSGTSGRVLYDNGGVLGEMTTTGSGTVLALATSPVLVTPTLGVASATTINKVTLTAPATGSTLTIADGKVLTASNTLTFTGTDGSSIAFGAGGTVLYANQTITLSGAVTGSGTTAITTTFATPGTLSVSSTNSNANAHTHAITSSSAPGAAASILATDASGIIGSTGTRIVKIWATDLTVTNAITGSVTGNAGTVSNATFTTALTVNTGTLTLTASAANTSVLTIGAGAVSVSGSNTGDQNLFSNIPVSGQTTVTANSTTTALTFVAGSNMTITTDNTAKTITFASSGGGGTPANPTASVGLSAVNGSATTYMRSDGAPALSQSIAPTWTGIHTFSPAARSSGTAAYLTINGPADTGITASTESKGINIVGSTRTWADGTVTTQREYFFGKPTYNKTTTSATFTNAYTLYIEAAPTAGTGVTITNGWAAGIFGNLKQSGRYMQLGNASPNNTLISLGSSPGMEFWGTDNTTGGVQVGVGNTSNGTSAYNGFFLNNDLASSNDATHYAFIGLTSSAYTDTTFGTAFAIANQLQFINTDGALTFATAKTTTVGYHNFLVNGFATTNEVARFTNAGLTVGLAGTLTGSIKMSGATSGTIEIKGVGTASGVNTLQAVTDTFVYRATTDTLTNKRITKRTGTTASSATPTINTDNVDFYSITALSAAITSFTTNLSGTPTEAQTLWIAITDNGTARAITWGASFEASGNVALPTTTVISTRLDVGFVWNTVTSKWRCVSVA